VLTDAGNTLPFNVRDKSILFFAGDPSRVRVVSGNTERVYSLTLPRDVGCEVDAAGRSETRHSTVLLTPCDAVPSCGPGSRWQGLRS